LGIGHYRSEVVVVLRLVGLDQEGHVLLTLLVESLSLALKIHALQKTSVF